MRSRNIKPDFFRDAELAEVTIEARYLFIGLWCLADREGKLKDKPKQIRFEVFPETKTNDDIETLLDMLCKHDLIIRYTVLNCQYIKVVNFLKHQSPHHTEMQSKIPNPPCVTVSHREPPEISSDIPLIPDSLIPDSLIPEKNTPPTSKKSPKKSKISMPDDFGISDNVKTWAQAEGFNNLDAHLINFRDYALSNGKLYADWDAAFRRAIRDDWAKLRGNGGIGHQRGQPMSKADQVTAGNLAARDRLLKKYHEQGE